MDSSGTDPQRTDLQEFVEAVRARTPIADVLASAGVQARHEGQRLRARCPFHQDAEPSFVVFAADGRGPEHWRCFGGCQRGGDVFSLLELLHKHQFRWEAITSRARELGLEPPSRNGAAPHRLSPVEGILAAFARAYAAQLNDDVLAYLSSRGLPPDFVRAQGIGYAPPDQPGRVAGVVVTQLTPDQRQLAERIGLLDRRGDYFGSSHGGGWIVIPNRRGTTRRVIDLQGRAFPEDPRKPRWLTRPGHIRFLFNEDALHASRVILAEGLTDALTLLAAGYRDTTAVYGQGGFKSDWMPRFARCAIVYVAFDRDATAKAVQLASQFGQRGRVVLLPADLGPKGDVNTLRVQLGSAGRFRQTLDQLLKQAPLPLEVAVATVEVQPLTTLQARLTPLLQQIAEWPDAIVRDHLTRLLANRCGLTLEVVRRAMRDAAREATEATDPEDPSATA